MKPRLRLAASVLSTALLALLLTAPAALATEGGERTKVELFEGPRDVVGMLFVAGLALAGGLALKNAVQQLSGKRDAADGKWRWR